MDSPMSPEFIASPSLWFDARSEPSVRALSIFQKPQNLDPAVWKIDTSSSKYVSPVNMTWMKQIFGTLQCQSQ